MDFAVAVYHLPFAFAFTFAFAFPLYILYFHSTTLPLAMSGNKHPASSPLRGVTPFHPFSFATPRSYFKLASDPVQRPSPEERVSTESSLPIASPPDLPATFAQEIKGKVDHWLSSIADGDNHEMFQLPEKYGSESSSPGITPRAWIPVSRRGSWMLTSRRFAFLLVVCLGILVLNSLMSRVKYHGVSIPVPYLFQPLY